jgi:hypothetical protein
MITKEFGTRLNLNCVVWLFNELDHGILVRHQFYDVVMMVKYGIVHTY